VTRFTGIDVGQRACEVAIAEDGKVRSAGRIATTREQLELFAQSLGPNDHRARRATGPAPSLRDLTHECCLGWCRHVKFPRFGDSS
jgi:hypothetical protein